MSWFQVYKYVLNTQTEEQEIAPVKIPLRRLIDFNSIKKGIKAGDQIYADLLRKPINSFINSELQTQIDNYSYIVVHQDEQDEDYFVPTKSRVVDDVLFFEAVEDIEKDTLQSKYYAVYYGTANLKYIVEDTYNQASVYIKPDIFTQSYYDIGSTEFYTYTADINSELYSLAYYNSGIDWIDGVSKKIEAKAFGIFDGPKLRVIGSKGKSYGKFRIRIFSYSNEETISSIPAVDWVDIDCYSSVESSNEILYQIENLEYNKYIFEIETLGNKNPLASSNDIKIDKYMFNPNYGLFCDKEQINPNISFITIAGVR